MLNEQLQNNTTMNKRLFQVFDEMNVNDEANKTAKLGCCYDMVDARTAKGGGHVTMGVPAEAITRMFLGEVQPILLLLDKKEYHRVNDQPVELSEAEQRAERYEKALRGFASRMKEYCEKMGITSLELQRITIDMEEFNPTPKTSSND